uniref:Peptidase S1 domain-containing protein n=1 Tax=Rhinolophus ferrumequinum TaxID=59479 RepID=A0A671FH53_RHIFE
MNSLSFCLSGKVLISSLFLKNIFTRYSNIGWQWVSSGWLYLPPSFSALKGSPACTGVAALWGSPDPTQIGPHCSTLSEGGVQSLPGQARPGIGPVICNGMLHGIVSWGGFPCQQPNQPGV